jgi:hypothetical protein
MSTGRYLTFDVADQHFSLSIVSSVDADVSAVFIRSNGGYRNPKQFFPKTTDWGQEGVDQLSKVYDNYCYCTFRLVGQTSSLRVGSRVSIVHWYKTRQHTLPFVRYLCAIGGR